jgi:murein DD-endopeptidase MepM/ murein hydrolase activator NlpD
VKKAMLLVGVIAVALLAWLAAGSPQVVNTSHLPERGEPSRAAPASPPPMPVAERPPGAPKVTTVAPVAIPESTIVGDRPAADIPSVTTTESGAAVPPAAASGPRPLLVPVSGVDPSSLHDMFDEVRGNRRHEALDLLAPRGTPVVATDDGVVKKLFTSVPGGLTVYQFDPDQNYCYYYAHLDHYADGLHEGQHLQKGEVIAYVGTTGNAPKDTPHLHFAVIRLDPDKRWWKGTYINPYPLLYQPHNP